jgi:hypothetical protein
MCRQGCAIDSWALASNAYSLSDIEDDACEAIFIKVDFLMVWNLTNNTVWV